MALCHTLQRASRRARAPVAQAVWRYRHDVYVADEERRQQRRLAAPPGQQVASVAGAQALNRQRFERLGVRGRQVSVQRFKLVGVQRMVAAGRVACVAAAARSGGSSSVVCPSGSAAPASAAVHAAAADAVCHT